MGVAASFTLSCLALEAYLDTTRLLYSLAGGITFGLLCFVLLLRSGRLWNLGFRPHVGHVIVDLFAGVALLGAFVSWSSVAYGEFVAAGAATIAGRVGEGIPEDACRQHQWAASLAGETDAAESCTAAFPAEQARHRNGPIAAQIQIYFDQMLWEARLWIALPTLALIALALGWTSSTAYRSLRSS